MKKVFTLLSFCISLQVQAQIPFLVKDSININNINATNLVHGDMWYDPGTYRPQCNYPNGSAKNIGFAAALWMSGYDDAGQLHVAAQTYRQDGNDYWPGPLDATGNLNYATSAKWAKIWKVTRAEINAHRSNTTHDVSNTPNAILTWPGKGNVNAAGKDGDPLIITTEMAPFVDLNGDGIYQPLSGEYPAFNGEQALWWLFSDNGPTHNQSMGLPLKVEIHALAYAYSRGTLIDNVVYYEYTIVNKSAQNYHNFRMALWSDVDLGYFLDDFIAFDSVRRMGITYNATNDDGATAGYPANSYGLNPPASGITLLSLPGDAGATFVPAGSFNSYNNDNSIVGNPTVDTEFNFYMRSRIRNGNHLQHAGHDIDYIYKWNPSDTSSSNECVDGNNPGDRRMILTSNDFTITAGNQQKLIIALVVRDSVGGCPDMNLDGIMEVADTAWYVFHNPPPPLQSTPIASLPESRLTIYPNPATGVLNIDCSNCTADQHIGICDVVGRQLSGFICPAFAKIAVDISSYSSGVYTLRNICTGKSGTQIFVKE